jgi:translocation and assembly module TamB
VRYLYLIPARVLQAMALLALALVLAFFALTRTEVGRDGLRHQIERSFAATYEGSLEIGGLTGNLVYDLTATDVRLRDPQGRTVIAADSVLLSPTWIGLLQRRLALDEATLLRPAIALVLEDGRWNLADALEPRNPSTEPGGDPLDLSAPEIRILGGTLTTRSDGPPPDLVRDGTLFDYTNARVTELDADLDLNFDRRGQRIRVRSLAARLPGLPLEIASLEGTLTLGEGDVLVRGLGLVTGASRIEGDVRLWTADGERHVALDLAPSVVSGDEVRRVVPAAPVADAVAVSGRVEGPLRALALDDVRLARGATDLRLSGTLIGLPDSAAFAVTVPRSTLREADLRAVLPTLALPDLRGLGTATLSLDADGALRSTPAGLRVRAHTHFDLASDAGRTGGSLRLDHRPGAPLAYALDATTRGLDLGRLLGDPALSGAITGRVALDGRGTTGDALASDLRLALGPSTIAGRRVDSLAVDVRADGRRFTGTAAVRAGGRLHLAGTADLDAGLFDLLFDAVGLDLRRVLDGAPPTDLTAEGRLEGTGRSLADFQGALAVRFDASTVTLGAEARPVPAHTVTLALAPAEDGSTRLDLDGDLLALRADGLTDAGALVALGTQWTNALVRTGRVEAAKYYRAPPDSLRPVIAPLAPPAEAAPQALSVRAELRRPRALEALVPGFPAFAPGTKLHADARLAPDSLALVVVAQGDSLQAPGVQSGAFTSTLRLESGYAPTLIGRSTLDLYLLADTLRLPIGPLADATAELSLRGRTLDLDVRSERLGEAGRFALDAALTLRPEVNRLTIHALEVVTAGQTWAAPGPQTVDLYADAIRLDALAFVRQNDPAPTPPRLAFRGTLSPLPSDSLHVEATALDLDEVFTFVGLRDFFGGRLDAELDVAAVFGQPVVVGEAAIERFTFAGRRAGEIALSSRYVPGTDAVAVDLRLTPDSVSVRNDLRASGTVRFPGRTDDGARDPGALDLALDIDRLDLFVFDWLFPAILADASGYATGTGRITGVPRVPLFDADLDVFDGFVRVPDFGLAIGAEGRVLVDREGFHLRNVLLTDKAGGQGLVRGDVLFNDYRFFSLDLAADLAEMEIVDVPDSRDLPFYGHIRATGSATLSGPLDNVFLRSTDAQTTADSEMFIPVTASGPTSDAGFLVFADSLGNVPELEERRSVLGERPETERAFLDGLEMSLTVAAPPGSTVHLVFDPLIGDVITAVGSARLQLVLREGEFLTYGTFDVTRGDYLFTAGDVFTRRFGLEGGGTLQWDGDPIDARLALPATYRTRASLAGLDLPGVDVDSRQRVPIVITTNVTGRVTSPLVDLSIALDETNRTIPGAEALRRQLNQPDRQAEYATSVLLTNSFLLAPSEDLFAIRKAADELFFTSLSQLVSSRLNLFLNDALGSDNLDVNFGVQQGADLQDFDVTYGVALRLLDERLVIRGEGLYQRLDDRPVSEELQGEVAVEVRLAPGVALEVFYRREGDLLLGSGLSATPYGSYGAGVNYETQFPSWRALLRRILGESSAQQTAARAEG